MTRFRAALFIPLLLVAGQTSAGILFLANLTTSQETVPPTLTNSITGAARPTPFGTAVLFLNDAQTQLSMTATIFNIDVTGTQTPDANDNLAAAHIHVRVPPGPLTGNFPVRWGFFGTPDNDNNPDQLVVTPFASGVGGTFTSIWDQPEGNASTTLTSNLPEILAGNSYLNFHTAQNPGGEIRGQILIPEPAILALLGLGLAGMGFLRRNPR